MAPKPDKKAAKAEAKLAKVDAAPAPAPAPATVPAVAAPPSGAPLMEVADRLGGARLCYGSPVQQGDRTIVPVARVRGFGGFGWGANRGDSGGGDGGGGGGRMNAVPIGFIEVGPTGSSFTPIVDPIARARTVMAVAAAAVSVAGAATVTVAGGLAAARLVRAGRRVRHPLRRGR